MVDAQHDGLLVCFLFCFVLFIFCLPSFCFRYPFPLFWRQHLIFSFGGLSSPTLATAPDAPARVGVRERLGLRQHLAAAWRRQPRRARAWRRPGRGRGLCTTQAAASSCFWKERGQQRHSAQRPSTAVAEKTHRVYWHAGHRSQKRRRESAVSPQSATREAGSTGWQGSGGRAGGGCKIRFSQILQPV